MAGVIDVGMAVVVVVVVVVDVVGHIVSRIGCCDIVVGIIIVTTVVIAVVRGGGAIATVRVAAGIGWIVFDISSLLLLTCLYGESVWVLMLMMKKSYYYGLKGEIVLIDYSSGSGYGCDCGCGSGSGCSSGSGCGCGCGSTVFSLLLVTHLLLGSDWRPVLRLHARTLPTLT